MRAAVIAVVLLLMADVAAAQEPIDADRPGLADTSTVVGKGWLQIETGLQWERRGSEKTLFFPTLFRIGLTDRLEARVEGNTFTRVESTDTVYQGLSPTSLGFEFVMKPDGERTPGLAAIGRVFPPWGSDSFAGELVSGDVRLVSDWKMSERWTLNPNAGIAWYEGDEGRYTAGLFALTLEFESSPGLAWFVDTGIQTPEEAGGATSVIGDAGVAYIPRQNWQFDVSAGVRTHGNTGPKPFIGVGVAYRHK